MIIDDDAELVPLIPQSYPLWAVRACSAEDRAYVGLVIGWRDVPGDMECYPIVAAVGAGSRTMSSAEQWHGGLSHDEDDPGSRWVETVEFYLTQDEAQDRSTSLLRDVVKRHHRVWPQDGVA